MTSLLVLWEAALALLCVAIVRRWVPRSDWLIAGLLLNIGVAALAATVTSFLLVNSVGVYLAIAAVLALLGVWIWRGTEVADESEWRIRPGWFAVGTTLLFAALWTCCIRPVTEVDSLYNLHFVLNWFANRSNPYDFAFHYVPFWELSALPGIVLTRSDAFFWLQSAKPVALLAGVLWLIGGEFGLPLLVRRGAVVSAMLFPHLWFHPSGVATLKNDMVHAAGEALLALVILRGVRRVLTPVDIGLLAAAVVFLSVKFSGPVFLLGGLGLFVLLAWRWIPGHLRQVAVVGGICAAVWFITAGHYYLHNLLTFGNPFYPFQINVGPVHLPGLGDLSNTSILFSLHDPRVWRAFFLPRYGLSPAGVLFPIMLLAILIVCPLLALREWWRRKDLAILGFCVLQLAVWGLYFRSVYSASGQPGDLQFVIHSLNSIRYVEGALLAAELFFLWLLMRARVPVAALLSLVALQGASRLWLLWQQAPQPELASAGVILGGFVSALWWAEKGNGRRALGLTVVAFLALIYTAPTLIEQQRREWLPEWQSLYRLPRLVRKGGAPIFLVIDGENSGQALLHLPLGGVSNRVITGTWKDLPNCQPLPGWIVRMKQGGAADEAADKIMPREWLAANHYVDPHWLRKQQPPPNGLLLEHDAPDDQAGK